MKKYLLKRLAAGALSICLLVSQGMIPISAYTEGPTGGGLCEHHPEHTQACGFVEGTPCSHVCSEDSGCITKVPDCPHGRDAHDDSCGYSEDGSCAFVCADCQAADSSDVPGAFGVGPSDVSSMVSRITITAFDGLDEAVQKQSVPAGTPLGDLELPTNLGASGYAVSADADTPPGTASDSGKAALPLTIENVEWELDPEHEINDGSQTYNPDGGTYCFTPVLPDGYAPAEGVSLPEIWVMVGENNRMPLAEGTGEFTVTGGVLGQDYSYADNTLTILTGTALTISGNTNRDKVKVKEGIHANVTLAKVSIIGSFGPFCAFDVTDAAVTLTLAEGSINRLISGTNYAGLQVPEGATLIIQGSGQLTTAGGRDAACIGGGNNASGGNITINSGTVIASNDWGAAGIGGGSAGSGGNITINGGTVTATSGGSGGAGIGGGLDGKSGTITISGGTVTATSDPGGGAGIGGGLGGSGETITISGGIVQATGSRFGAGIGGGGSNYSSGTPGGTIIISGGTVTAQGGELGAGIGGGGTPRPGLKGGDGGTITISGGTVTAAGGTHGAGIGGSKEGLGGTVTISGAATHVKATSSNGRNVGSGPSRLDGGSLSVTEGAILEMTGNGTNAENPVYKNCTIIGKNDTVTYNNEGLAMPTLLLEVSPQNTQAYLGEITLKATLSGAVPSNANLGIQFSTGNITQIVPTDSSGVATYAFDASPLSPGTYNFTVTFSGNAQNATVTKQIKNYEVTKRSLTGAAITLEQDSYTYTGSEHQPAVTSVVADGISVPTNAYEVSYQANTNIGTAVVIVKAKTDSNFSGSATKNFMIIRAQAPEIQWPTADPITYGQKLSKSTLNGGSSHGSFAWVDDSLVPTVKNSGYPVVFTPSDPSNYDYSQVDGWDSSSRTVTKTVAVSVSKAPLSITASNHAITYGEAPRANGSILYGLASPEDGATLSKDLTYTYDYTQYGDVGTYTITPKGVTADNYNITFHPGTLTVNPKEVGLTWNHTADRKFGDGKTVTAQAEGTVNGDSVDVTVTGGGETAVGNDYTATATGLTGSKAANYKLPTQAAVTYSIAKADGPALSAAAAMYRYQPNYQVKLDLTQVSGYPKVPGGAPSFAVTGGSPYQGLTSVTIEDGSTLVLVADNTSSRTNDVVTVSITGMDNYEDGTITVTVSYTNKPSVIVPDVDDDPEEPQAPPQPSLRVAGRTPTSVSLAWDPVEGAEGYTLWYRSEYETSVSRKIFEGSGVTAWTQEGLEPGTKYFYTLRAWVHTEDGYLLGEASPVQRGTTKPEAAAIRRVTAKDGRVKVALEGQARGAGRYAMCVSKDPAFGTFQVGIRTSYTIRTLNKKLSPGTYYVRVKSYRDLGNGKRVYGEWSNQQRIRVK